MFTRAAIAGVLCLAAAAGAARAQESGEARDGLRWWKGNTHTHSLWSDGDMAPELIAQWYVDRGYHFLAFSEHNVLQEGERHTTIREETKLSPERVAPIREQFGDDWLDIDDSGRFPRMRLKTHKELSAHFNKPGEFLLLEAARMRDETLDDLALAAITVEALAAHLVIAWHGVEDEDGAPVPFSIEAWRSLVALDPRLVSYARTAFDKHLLAAEQAVREGNGSPPSASGAHGAA